METNTKISKIEDIIPDDEIFPIINLVYQSKILKSKELNTNSMVISCLDLISRERINIRFSEEIQSIKAGKKPLLNTGHKRELEIMEKIEFTINSKQMKKLYQRDQTVLKMFKDINKNHVFDLKSMYEKISKKEVAINFAKYFNNYVKSVQRETKFNEKEYGNIIKDGTFTFEGNELHKEWNEFKHAIKSDKSYYTDVENESEFFDKYLIYGKCFEIEKDVLKNIQKTNPDYDSKLYKFLSYNGDELLKLNFDKGLSNSKIERKGDGSIPAGNSKYFVPGFG